MDTFPHNEGNLHGHSQAWTRGVGGCTLPGKVVKCFDALVMTVKCSVDHLFMHYFQKNCQLLGGLCPRPPSVLRDESPRPPNLPTPGKNPAGAQDSLCCTGTQWYMQNIVVSVQNYFLADYTHTY